MNFTKDILAVSSFYDFKNTVKYDILEEETLKSTLIIHSTLTAKILTEGRKYYIKPVIKYLSLNALEILSEKGKIGEIKFWGWSWRNPKLVINNQGEDEVWIFNRNEPGFFKSRSNPYKTYLTFKEREISYDILLKNFLVENTRNECLRRVEGMALFNENERLICLLGVYLNELLIFDEIDK